MLDPIFPWGRPLRPSLSTQFSAQVAREPWEVEAYWRLRRSIFAEEQALFEGSDIDEPDRHAIPIVAESHSAGMPECVVGVVRIYEVLSGGAPSHQWYGGRLGVDSEYRRQGAIGTALIATAVRTAHALGCQQFLATVQLKNVRYFERHHFRPRGPLEILGRPHMLMEADLGSHPPAEIGAELAELIAAYRFGQRGLAEPTREVA